MKALKVITGKVKYMNLGTGFWAIFSRDGQEYRPVNMPEQLKAEGAHVHCTASEVEEEMSIFMWGTPVRIVSFQTTLN